MRTFLYALIIATSCVATAETATFYFASDVPAYWGGSDFTSHEILQNADGVYTSVLTLPQGIEISALCLRPDNSWQFSLSHPAELDGVVYDQRDVIVFNGVSYSLYLNGNNAGVPQGARIDALFLISDSELGLSFDIPVSLNSVEYSQSDLISYNGSGYSLYWDAEAAGVPANANVVGAEIDESLRLILSFDVPLELGGVLYLARELVLWNGSSFSSYYLDNSGPPQARFTDFAFPIPVNNPPVANDDAYSIDENNTLVVDSATGVLSNDFDIDGDPLTAVLVNTTQNGSLTLNTDGSFIYAPNANFNGIDTFTYKANDGNDDSNVATVTIIVNPVNNDPVAVDDFATTDQDTPVTINVLENDFDVDGDTLSVSGVTNGSNGTVTNNNDGTVTYTPFTGFFGDDSFIYTIEDGNGGSDSATVHVTVVQNVPEVTISINDVSMIEPQTGSVNATLTVSLSGRTVVDVTVDFATTDGTATAGLDYIATIGSVTIPAGETTASITVEILADSEPFEGNETVVVNLSNPSFGTIGDAQGVITITETCLFCDDFEDGQLALDWTYIKQNWTENGGSLHGTPAGRKAIAVASPVFPGCTNCSISTSMRSAGGIGSRIWLLGWYIDKKNTVELLMKEENNKWVLKQRSNGSVVGKAKGLGDILPNISYNVDLSFDGTNFEVRVDGQLLIAMPAAAPVSNGTVGFQSKNTTASFGDILVN